jgi:hypothetical protein
MTHATLAAPHRLPRHFGIGLWLLGSAGIVTLLLAPLEVMMPPGMAMPTLAFRALAMINPLVLTALAVALGCWAAPRVGLDAPLLRALAERRPAGAIARRQAPAALAAGIVCALVLLAYGAISAPWLEGTMVTAFRLPLATKLLYGGIVEELLMRWGVMSLFVWLGWKALGSRATVPAAAYVAGIAVAAALFAAGHLPALFALVPAPPTQLIVAVVVANAVPGLLLGVLFWRRGLEAAIAAHALAHLFVALAGAG